MERMLLQALPEHRSRGNTAAPPGRRPTSWASCMSGMLLQLDRNKEATTALLGLYRSRQLTAADTARRARILYERGAVSLFLQS